MKWFDLVWELSKHSIFSPYIQLGVVSLLLMGVTFYFKLSEGKVMGSGIYISFGWLPMSMIISLLVDLYWVYLLHWFLAVVGFFAVYVLALYCCEKYGSPYLGDGGMVMILPIYLTPVVFVGSLVLKGAIWTLRFLF